MLFKKIYQFGDKLEDKVRGKLSHYPIIYAFVGGSGIIIFWRGIWHLTDFLVEYVHANGQPVNLIWWDGILSIVIGAALLLMVGLFVSSFIGNEIIISGLKGEKKIVERAEQEIQRELVVDVEIRQEMEEITVRLERIKRILEKKK